MLSHGASHSRYHRQPSFFSLPPPSPCSCRTRSIRSSSRGSVVSTAYFPVSGSRFPNHLGHTDCYLPSSTLIDETRLGTEKFAHLIPSLEPSGEVCIPRYCLRLYIFDCTDRYRSYFDHSNSPLDRVHSTLHIRVARPSGLRQRRRGDCSAGRRGKSTRGHLVSPAPDGPGLSSYT